jgi:excinuclease ABC subunit A
VAEGTPEKVAKAKGSFTGKYLAPLLEKRVPEKVQKASAG